MKNKILIGLIVLLVLVSGCAQNSMNSINNSNKTANNLSLPYIDPAVIEALKNQSEVEVIIIFKNDNLPLEEMIGSLSPDEFRLKQTSAFGGAFEGNITKKGLEKLKRDTRILSIFKSKLGVAHGF